MNTLIIQLACLVAFTSSIAYFRIFGAGFKLFAISLLVIIVVWGIAASVAIYNFVKLSVGGHLASLSLGGTIATVIAVCFCTWLGFTVYKGSSVPRIHHISTDTINPPMFDKILTLRTPSHNLLDYTPAIAEQQREHYGHIQPLPLSVSAGEVFDVALLVVDKLGWRLQSQNPKRGIIEASASSGVFGFIDDVVIRIQANGDASIVDIRSVSRVGESDFGANAKRIKQYLQLLSAEIAN